MVTSTVVSEERVDGEGCGCVHVGGLVAVGCPLWWRAAMEAVGWTGRVRRLDPRTMLGVFRQTYSVLVFGVSAVSVVVKCMTGPGFRKSRVVT
jgi:hypothetical protein